MNIMKTQIQQWGNSLGIRIPKQLAGQLHLKKGISVNLEICDNHLIISPEISELDILLGSITDNNRHKEELNHDEISGNEKW